MVSYTWHVLLKMKREEPLNRINNKANVRKRALERERDNEKRIELVYNIFLPFINATSIFEWGRSRLDVDIHDLWCSISNMPCFSFWLRVQIMGGIQQYRVYYNRNHLCKYVNNTVMLISYYMCLIPTFKVVIFLWRLEYIHR